MSAWQTLRTAPIDEWVILGTTGDHVGQAIQYDDENVGKTFWEWANGARVHEHLTPLAWQPMPQPPSNDEGEA